MNRRDTYLALLALLALGAAPFPAEAQQAGKVWRIGYLSGASAENDKNWFAAFQQGMQDLGYVEGKSFVMEQRYSEGRNERLSALATELVGLKTNVLVVFGAAAARAANKATSTIPIVMTVTADPVGDGLAASLARPGGNVTGLSDIHSVLVTKRLELLKEVVPSASRVGVLMNADSPTLLRQLRDIQAAAPAFGVTILSLPVSGADDIERAFATMKKERLGGILVLGDPMINTHRRQVVGLAEKSRMPAVFTVKENAEAGGLMAYGTNFADLWRRAATYVDKILRGANPADLPIEQPIRFELVVNMKTAKAIGVTIPRSVLLRADRVIE